MTEHQNFLSIAYECALESYKEGGLPIGAVLVRNNTVIARGHNQRVQKSDPIAHGEMDCLRVAGRQRSYRDTVLYTTLAPCMMCTGTIIQFKIPKVVIGESVNFPGNKALLIERGVEVVDLNDARCIALMEKFIREKPELWNEDIADD
ncbi:MAG: cytosine/creatinine deaminase [Hyphomicrobiales bacterium]|jgi:cytosine deaminase|nr:cytosine/creatinine deaminase [Hyphomicrobiales bacterium]